VSANLSLKSFAPLLLSKTPLIDLRAPVEFSQGALPNATNLPILNNQERAQVGTCYQHQGQAAAITLGEKLVSGGVLQERLDGWCQFIKSNPNTLLYCFRGGLRSLKSQEFLAAVNVETTIIEGGYKRVRNYLLEQLESLGGQERLLVLAGETGSDKTGIINSLIDSLDIIDLEGLAAHRGSAFGATGEERPTQINFEHALTMELLQLQAERKSTFTLIEDESQRIGNCSLNSSFYQNKQNSPTFRLTIPLEERVYYTRTLYVESWWNRLVQESGEDDIYQRFLQHFQAPLDRIKKRLGGAKHQEAVKLLQVAVEQQRAGGSFLAHDGWINLLLADYYDPLYRKTIEQKRVVGQGDRQEFLSFVKSWHPKD